MAGRSSGCGRFIRAHGLSYQESRPLLLSRAAEDHWRRSASAVPHQEDAEHRPSRVYLHRLGKDTKDDELIYEEADKGFFVILRLYGPTKAFFDQSWKPSDIEKVK